MSESLTLNKILLTKLNSILNPNYVNKFILLTFSLGSALTGKNFILEALLSLELITQKFTLKLQLSDSANTITFLFGIVFIVISIWLFYKAHIESKVPKLKTFKNCKSASKHLIKLMEENERVFKECGPNSSQHNHEELKMEFSVWENAKQNIIVPNNKEIYRVISNFKKLSEYEQSLVNKMKSHIEHFEVHVDNPDVDYSEHQFPMEFSELVYSYKNISRKHKKKLDKINNWLKLELASLNIESAFLFGSFLYSENYHDIDLLIKTKDSNYQCIKKTAMSLKKLNEKFSTELNEKLHISIFSELESSDFEQFKVKIRSLEKVV
jgi:predicted nucleotidyltransferase